MKQSQGQVNGGRSRPVENLENVKSKPVGAKQKKAKFHELLAKQKQLKEMKREKMKEIERKREERRRRRKEHNVCMQKLTKKGQPVMKHRIKLLLKQLCPENS